LEKNLILAALLALPWWQVAPAYLLIGIIWAVAYLPRSITLQARAYKTWRDRMTGGRPLNEVLGPESATEKRTVNPEAFLRTREDHGFSERRILTGFIVNIAFWPLRVAEKLLFDILRSTFVWIFELLGDIWNKVIVPMLRALDRVMRAIGRGIRAFFRSIGRVMDAIWDNVIAPVCRAIQRCVRALWYDILVPLYTWAYRYVTTVYKTIIQRANREAIADLAALNNATQKDLAK
jgi:hypothetical protein